MMKVKVQKDGRITLPKKLREEAHIRQGQWLEIVLENGQVLLQPTSVRKSYLRLSEDHPIWKLVGQWASGQADVSSDKYAHLAQAYESKRCLR
ncbi:AbrB/MazE/SpoVT family DNA-binding domain-containing protein [Candidatus Acetothermia bacterium]|jgi:AbrB family looped-hinge helix DNA binding protein|nr:AbrB/MazE/SpoVT family DNA-binding domain-containing protein [Candidatus Acetothermia bacterium]MCI2432726.1 AbrB/MazE/SpoVT family DNA-binding domain-containing protein [Candidatus Acetothermia bacterium]MCI2435958.1 AbrB/MazE/SpoVT family DNA-binding domain-containing protein [Candidatus Acetothermia bacterium]